MSKMFACWALLAALVVAAPPWDAVAQSRGNYGGYSSGGAIGGGSSAGSLGRGSESSRSAPAIRSTPATPPYSAAPGAITTPGRDKSGYYRDTIGIVPPGTRGTGVIRR